MVAMKNPAELYVSATTAAKLLGCSRSSICRAAQRHGIGVFASGRLAALSQADISAIKSHLHESSGNPVWIAAAARRKSKKN